MVCFQMTSWLVGTKHFPKSKTLSRIQNTFQNPKTLPRIPKHFPESKTRPRGGGVLVSGTCFWILGNAFGFWEVFCPYEPR